jgi:type I restriction enzyme S subunit
VKAEWKTVALDEVATIERSTIQPEAISQGTAYLGLEHIESGGRILGAKPVDEGELASSKFQFTARHVLYGKLRPYLAKIACPDFTGICSTDILPILPGPNLERRFLCYFLRQPSMVDYANSRAAGANLPRLSPSVLAEFEIPLPSLTEQRRIAEVLDRAEALRAKRRAALAQLDSLTQSLFLDLFGDPATNPKQLPQVSLAEVTTRITDGTHLTPKFVDSGVPFIFVKNVRNGSIDFQTDKFISEEEHAALYKRCPVEEGDVLYTTVGATYGQAASVGTFTKFAFQRHLAHLKPDPKKVVPSFLGTTMQLPLVKRQADRWARGVAQPTINLKELREMVVPLPPISLQREFARRVTAVEKLKSTQRTSLAELDALFATLQHRAFRGEL